MADQRVESESDKYWAAQSADRVIAELKKKERAYFDFAWRRGHVAMWRAAYAQHYGLNPDGGSNAGSWGTQMIGFEGQQAELVRFRINMTRSFTNQLITLALGTRPSFQSYATNTDYDSIGQAEGADTLVNYVYEQKYGEVKERRTVKKGMLFGTGWTWIVWDKNGGEWTDSVEPVMEVSVDGQEIAAVDPVTGEPRTRTVRKRTGDISLKSLAPWEVFFEPTIEDQDDHLWRCVRERRSKYEIAGAFPDKRDQVLRGATRWRDEYAVDALFGFDHGSVNPDEGIVKHFYHAPSAALADGNFKDGRYIQYTGDTVLLDWTLPPPGIPLVDFMPQEYIASAMGYADSWDMIGLNQMLDQIMSDAASNITAFGRQNYFVYDGTDFTPQKIADGMECITGKPGTQPPVPIELAQLPAATQWLTGQLMMFFQELSGLNPTMRGQPGANITSGQMAALFHSIAIETNGGLQMAVDSHRTRVANKMLDLLKLYATAPVVMRIIGIDERPYAETFTRDRLLGVRGVTMKTANPMMRTQAGRLQIAEMQMRIPGAVEDPAQLNEILVSGQSKPLYDAPRKKRMRIKMENEILLTGPAVEEQHSPPPPALPNGAQMPAPPPRKVVPSVPVLSIDPHHLHVLEHAALLSSRHVIQDPARRGAILAHLGDHFGQWRETDPAVLTVLGIPPWPAVTAQAPPSPTVPGDIPMPSAVADVDQPMQSTENLGVTLPHPSRSPLDVSNQVMPTA